MAMRLRPPGICAARFLFIFGSTFFGFLDEGVVNDLFGGGFFLEGFVGFLVAFSKGDPFGDYVFFFGGGFFSKFKMKQGLQAGVLEAFKYLRKNTSPVIGSIL